MLGNNYNYKLPNLETLKILYFDNKLSTIQISKKYNVTSGAVKNKFNRYKIKLRTYSDAQKGNKNSLGFKYSKKYKKKLSILHKKLGHHPPSRKGIKLTEEHKRKLSIANKKRVKNGTHNFWKGGISYKPYSENWTKTLRKNIRERDGYICQLCSKYGKIVHHINYDKQNCNPTNLITLCEKCNPEVNFKRKYWIIYFNNLIKRRIYAIKKS